MEMDGPPYSPETIVHSGASKLPSRRCRKTLVLDSFLQAKTPAHLSGGLFFPAPPCFFLPSACFVFRSYALFRRRMVDEFHSFFSWESARFVWSYFLQDLDGFYTTEEAVLLLADPPLSHDSVPYSRRWSGFLLNSDKSFPRKITPPLSADSFSSV